MKLIKKIIIPLTLLALSSCGSSGGNNLLSKYYNAMQTKENYKVEIKISSNDTNVEALYERDENYYHTSRDNGNSKYDYVVDLKNYKSYDYDYESSTYNQGDTFNTYKNIGEVLSNYGFTNEIFNASSSYDETNKIFKITKNYESGKFTITKFDVSVSNKEIKHIDSVINSNGRELTYSIDISYNQTVEFKI
jgi:hypothetical protein